ncbi:hypothetical protein C8J35_102653 [Rhizobium sp. PP-F2F-G38]|nr:hypothetical protein C8J37_102653 [Rhizobium sp. PP-WC-1G-195]PYE99761.1 hypothetical protein C8J35_102653 [Rhizobium sp. PP-F2F-G38]
MWEAKRRLMRVPAAVMADFVLRGDGITLSVTLDTSLIPRRPPATPHYPFIHTAPTTQPGQDLFPRRGRSPRWKHVGERFPDGGIKLV